MPFEIVKQINENEVVLEDITSQKRFDFRQFSELLQRIRVKISKDRIPTLQILFDQMAEREEELSRAKILIYFGREFNNVGKSRGGRQQSSTSTRQLPEPPFPVNAFC